MVTLVVVLAIVLPLLVLGAVLFVPVRRIWRQDKVTKPWRGLGTWSPGPPDETALEWIRVAYPSGASRVLGAAHRDTITATAYGWHRGYRIFAHEWQWHEVGAGRPRTIQRTVISIELPISVPWLEIKRDGSTGDPGFARAVLTPPVAQWLLADPRAQYYPVRFAGRRVSIAERGGLHVETLGPPADFLVELLSRTPAI
ncbi:hypothetical protein FPZ12_023850 [Amycolatopsis acidicola]|uniref:DUF3137 domain-containing protein n=1 Tax=Amycolatopsis acidicola TaxID=2596893 RepID=A0A5N0V0F9_9PSEU|nr:hypothetical protein [Amycolatopsis acidicola]KAA9157927.1 hypothetical protein FPZ12_023850 [Amycolatopsis acidicola]